MKNRTMPQLEPSDWPNPAEYGPPTGFEPGARRGSRLGTWPTTLSPSSSGRPPALLGGKGAVTSQAALIFLIEILAPSLE